MNAVVQEQELQLVAEQTSPVQPVMTAQATPMAMLQLAVQQGADLEKLQKLMDLQERWERNEARKAFVAAMAAFKANPPEILKAKHVKFDTQRGSTEYYHATLADVCAAAIKGLADHGISHRWDLKQDATIITVTCVLTHEAGHSESVPMAAAADDSGGKNRIQAIGSTITYLERYTLLAATGLAARDMDDDGHGAGNGAGTPKRESKPAYPDAKFQSNLSTWIDLMVSGKKDADDIISIVERKFALSDEQKKSIRDKQPKKELA